MPEIADAFDNLMRKVRLGDGKALTQLLQRYEREVHQAASYLLGRSLRSSLDPSDLVQSVHRTLLVGFRDNKIVVTSPEKLVALAVAVARNKVLARRGSSSAKSATPPPWPKRPSWTPRGPAPTRSGTRPGKRSIMIF